ncbi:MAG: tetratricopeptide repeat protein [Bacteroidales bacterium]
MLQTSRIFGCLIGLILSFSLSSPAQDLKSAIKLTESEQFDASRKLFEELIAKEPNNGDNYYYNGESWIKWYLVDSTSISLKEVADPALQNFNKGIEKDPTNPLNFVGAGRVDILISKYDDAKADFDKAISLLPWKNFKKSLVSLSKQALTFAKIAEAKLKDPNIKQAELLELITKAIERADNVPEVYLIKGDIYLSFNDGSSAMVAYNKANYLEPTSSKILVKIGMLNVRSHSYDDALKNFRDAINYDSTFAPAYRERADLYGLGEQWENAIKDYQKFLDLSEKNTYAKMRYASFLFMAKKYEDALTVIKEVMLTDQNYNVLNRLAAYSYFETGKFPEGLASIVTFFKYAEKTIASDYAYYGKLLAKNNKDSLAIEKFQKAFEMDTTNYDILSEKAKSQNKAQDYDGAVITYQKKINANKASLTDYYDLGKIYFNMKQWDNADTAFGSLLAQKPDFINALKYKAIVNANIDSTSELGRAKKYYEALIVIYLNDSAKYAKDISTAYDYMRYYYFKQYNLNKKCEDAKISIIYCDKMLAIDPKDEKSLTIKKSLAGKCP